MGNLPCMNTPSILYNYKVTPEIILKSISPCQRQKLYLAQRIENPSEIL